MVVEERLTLTIQSIFLSGGDTVAKTGRHFLFELDLTSLALKRMLPQTLEKSS